MSGIDAAMVSLFVSPYSTTTSGSVGCVTALLASNDVSFGVVSPEFSPATRWLFVSITSQPLLRQHASNKNKTFLHNIDGAEKGNENTLSLW